MSQLQRKVGGYQGEFIYQQGALLINITNPNKSEMLFGRITNHAFPQSLKDLSDNAQELFQLIKDLADDKVVISPKNQLVFIIVMGKKTKQYGYQLERAQISNEQSLKNKIVNLEKQLEKKTFQAQFYKQQFNFLMRNLQLKPNIPQLQRLYEKQDVAEILSGKESLKESKLTNSSVLSSNSSKVASSASSIKKQDFKCPKMHPLVVRPTQHPSYRCNICRQMIPYGSERMRCDSCDFDACSKCSMIPPQQRKYCPQGHGVIFGAANNYLIRFCDICRKNLAKDKGYTCLTCGYDVCKGCL